MDMYTVSTKKGNFLFVPIPESCVIFIADMGYLIFKSPAYENWVTDDELFDYGKLMEYMERVEGKDEWKDNYIKLPNGHHKLLGVTRSFLADTHESAQNITEEIAAQIVDDNGCFCYDNYSSQYDNKYTCTTA